MNVTNITSAFTRTLIVCAGAAILLAACATVPVGPNPAAEARNKLTQLQSDPNLSTRAPQAIEAASVAVKLAEQPESDQGLVAYRVYLADRRVDIARATAQTRFAEDQRVALSAQRDQARLDARTHEANVAERQAAVARAEGAQQKAAADQARGAADVANQAADIANQNANAANQAAAISAQQVAELQSQIQTLQARPTERGLVLTLGDALFSSGRAELQPGASANLGRLVTFLNRYPDRTAIIEGHTDNIGSSDYNLGLSERRAGTVRAYLVDQGVSSTRLSASGKGASDPVAGNDTASGRQQNRRVEIIISGPAAASR